jgi:hypothetical protein
MVFFVSVFVLLAACTGTHEIKDATAVPIAVEAQLTATLTPTTISSPTSAGDELAPRVSAVSPVTIYGGPGSDYPRVGILEAGTNAQVLETVEGGWMNINCPDGIAGNCWILWDMNAIHSYEGPPVTLNIPDPSTLQIESTDETTSPDGHWEARVTQTETVALDGEFAFFFYVELTVTSLEDGTSWTPVSEWHVYGIGHENAPMPFYWSQDGRYLYYTSLFDMHGACLSMNIGERLDRLDLTDGTVALLQPPDAFRLLSISPPESIVAYLGGQSIINFAAHQVVVVRKLETAYDEGAAGQDSILWQIPLEIEWPIAVSEIVWSPDSSKLIVTATTMADAICNKASSTTWELDIGTGEFVEVSKTVFPTATP